MSNQADHEMISVIDAAKQLRKGKQTLFKVIRRLHIKPTKSRSSAHRNQFLAYITQAELRQIMEELRPGVSNGQDNGGDRDFCSAEQGVFYLVQLEPNHDPGRFKVGFAVSMSERLRHLRCSAPYAAVVKTWPCRRGWEKTAIDCAAANCEQVHTEVFRADSLDTIAAKCEQFFALMPSVDLFDHRPASAESAPR